MALSDRDVKAQLDRMVAFIIREAEDKSKEIQDKASEEFSLEKQRLVQTEKAKIIKDFERKEKQMEVARRIAASNALNSSRLRVLKAREDAIAKILVDAQKKLSELGQPSEQYKQLLGQLILQALLKLKEPQVVVRCRQVDKDLVQSQLDGAARAYNTKTGDTVKISLDTNWLAPPPVPGSSADYCSGGVILSTLDNRILCNNTLDQRLQLSYEQRLPDIRKMLFGKSATRKFTT